jgi:hypothetical protein
MTVDEVSRRIWSASIATLVIDAADLPRTVCIAVALHALVAVWMALVGRAVRVRQTPDTFALWHEASCVGPRSHFHATNPIENLNEPSGACSSPPLTLYDAIPELRITRVNSAA